MKRILFVLFVCTLFITGCREESNDPKDKPSYEMSPPEFFDYRIKKSEIVDSRSHMYYLYESGHRIYNDYAFSIEHRKDCKACLNN